MYLIGKEEALASKHFNRRDSERNEKGCKRKEEFRLSCSWMTSRPMRHMRWFRVELWVYKFGETVFLEHALKQSTHDNDDDDYKNK